MKTATLLSILILANPILANADSANESAIPSDIGLPQICKYTAPHEDFGTVRIEKNDASSIKVSGLEGTNGPLVLYYKGTFEKNHQSVFMEKEDIGLPPEVKLLPEGGKTVFYGNTWGYEVNCDVVCESPAVPHGRRERCVPATGESGTPDS